MKPHDIADLLAGVAAELNEQPDEQVTSEAVVKHGLGLLDGADHVSITVRERRQHETLASTSDLATDADAAQYELGEGPCLESADHGEWYRSGDVGGDARWPRWAPAAAQLGIASLLSVRLLAQGKPFGALNFYAESGGRFGDRDEVELAQLFAVHAATALVTARTVDSLETALTSRHDIGVAQGIIMARYGLSEDQSFSALRRISQQRNVKLREVAREVVDRGSLPNP